MTDEPENSAPLATRSTTLPAGGEHKGTPVAASEWPAPPVVGDPGSQQEVVAQLLSEPPGRADTVIDAGVVGALEVRASSVRGRSHRFAVSGHPARTRQDEYCLQATADANWLVVVVADGVSQGRFSHVAATIAARRGCQLVTDLLDAGREPSELDWDGEIAPKLAGYIVSEARRLAAATGEPDDAELSAREAARLMSSTAVIAVVGTSIRESGIPYVVSVLAGDSSAWVLADGEWSSLTAIKNEGAEIASMEVRGLPLVGACSTTDGALTAGEVLVLMTDGLGDALGSGSGDVGEFFSNAWKRAPDPHAFAAQLDFFRRSFDDDRTAVAIWRVDA